MIVIASEDQLAVQNEEPFHSDLTDTTLIYSSLNDDKLLIPRFYNFDPNNNEFFKHL